MSSQGIGYELAFELKNAGFPQGGNGKWIAPPDKIVLRREDRVYVPTLEELIEACGKVDFELNHNVGENWTACGDMKRAEGSTPTEAVANLWLALHKVQ